MGLENMLLAFAVLCALGGVGLGAFVWSILMDRIKNAAASLCGAAFMGVLAYFPSTQVEGEIHLRDLLPTTFAWAAKLPDISASVVAIFALGAIVGGTVVGLLAMTYCTGRKTRRVYTV
jgi:hypothetical protein